MHHRLFVTLSAPADATSEAVRCRVHARLLADDSFCGPGGRFGSPLCDWFVLGGRWSGCLTAADPGPRDRFADLGAEDDAVPLTAGLLDTLLAPYLGVAEHRDGPWGCEYADLDGDPLTRDAVGRKWLAVVDYHN